MEDTFVRVKKEEFIPSSDGSVKLTPNFFCVITQEVMQDKELSAAEKLMYGVITSLCHAKGFCWANNSFFEEQFDKDERSIRRWLNDLKIKDYITLEFIISEETNEQLERRIYPMMNIDMIRRLAHNSKIGRKI